MFCIGLGLIIYASTHPEMNDVINTRDNLYITGGVFIFFSIIFLIGGIYWYRAVEKSSGLRMLNAGLVELELFKTIL